MKLNRYKKEGNETKTHKRKKKLIFVGLIERVESDVITSPPTLSWLAKQLNIFFFLLAVKETRKAADGFCWAQFQRFINFVDSFEPMGWNVFRVKASPVKLNNNKKELVF